MLVIIFGAGSGYQALDFTPFGEEYDLKLRAEKLDEGLTVLKRLWTGEPFNFVGKHYQIHDVRMLPKPLQSPRIPVWLAGGWPNRKPFRRAALWDGIYLMAVNQVTGKPLAPAETREIVAYMHTYRENTDPFEVVVSGETPADPRKGTEIVQPYREAGATWWIEAREFFEECRERIRQGPPKGL